MLGGPFPARLLRLVVGPLEEIVLRNPTRILPTELDDKPVFGPPATSCGENHCGPSNRCRVTKDDVTQANREIVLRLNSREVPFVSVPCHPVVLRSLRVPNKLGIFRGKDIENGILLGRKMVESDDAGDELVQPFALRKIYRRGCEDGSTVDVIELEAIVIDEGSGSIRKERSGEHFQQVTADLRGRTDLTLSF